MALAASRLWAPWRACLIVTLGCVEPSGSYAQQPFIVDDAAVAAPGVWHVEVSNQADVLRRSSRPALWQDTVEVEIVYGFARRWEASALVPMVALFTNDGVTAGVGDSSFGVKYRLTPEDNARHQFALAGTVELPTGSAARQLGSGLVDYGLTLITEHHAIGRSTVRTNLGAVLVGNTQTGLVGVSTRGGVLVAGTSYVHPLSSRVQAGGEVVAFMSAGRLCGSSVTWQLGGNVLLAPSATFDVAVGGGWLAASPRLGLQVGVSIDLTAPRPAGADAELRLRCRFSGFGESAHDETCSDVPTRQPPALLGVGHKTP